MSSSPDPHMSKLTQYSLGKSGLKVSKVILGAMSYGTSKWQPWVLDEDESLPLLEHAYKCGINTWDTVCLVPFRFQDNLTVRLRIDKQV